MSGILSLGSSSSDPSESLPCFYRYSSAFLPCSSTYYLSCSQVEPLSQPGMIVVVCRFLYALCPSTPPCLRPVRSHLS